MFLTRGRRDRNRSERLVDDADLGPAPDLGEELDHVVGLHADAAVAGRGADAPFLGGAVDVDVAAVGAGVLAFQAVQPDDAADDGVASGGVWPKDFAGALPVLEDGSGGSARANFFAHFEAAQRGGVAAGPVAEAKFRGGDGIFGGEVALGVEAQFLIGNADDDLMVAVAIGAASEEQEETEQPDAHGGMWNDE